MYMSKLVRGFRDIFEPQSNLFTELENCARGVFSTYGFGELRLPTVELKELFVKSTGETTDIVPEYLYRYYPEAVKGTIMEGSELRVRVVPVRIRCAGCGKDYHPDRSHSYACPDCGQCEGEILAGKGMSISEITMETGDGPQADLL